VKAHPALRAVVLVGGEGTRLRPLTLTTPKQVLPIVEVPMIERVAAHLSAHGVDEAVLSLGYKPDAFLSVFPGDRCGPMRITYAEEPSPLDTAGAIRFAAVAAGITATFVVVNGDVLTDVDITALVAFHRSRGAEGTIHLHRVADPSAYGLVITDGDGRVEAFVEKPPPGLYAHGDINAGTYVLEPSVLDRIAADRRVSIEREVFPAMADDGTLFAAVHDGYWIDTGTPARYLQAQLDLVAGRRPGPPAPDAARREDDVWTIGHPVLDGRVVGPTLVGAAAFVQAGALVEGSVVGSGARVHDRAEVRGSVLLPGAAVRSRAVVEDSIVGVGAVIGEGARVAGLSVVGPGSEVEPGADLVGARVPAVPAP
jgi:NDP-sugar pyrophosphorylase family protein